MQIVKPNTNYPFLKKRKPFLIMSVVLVSLGLAAPFVLEPNLGTSFRGGSSIVLHFDDAVSSEDVRSAFTGHVDFADVSVQSLGSDERRYLIKTRNTTSMGCEKLASLREAIPPGLDAAGIKGASIDSWPVCEGEGLRGDFYLRFGVKEGSEQADATTSKTVDLLSGVSRLELEKVVNAAEVEANVAYDPASRRFIVKPSGLQAEVTTLLQKEFPQRFNPDTGLDEIVTVGADVGEKFNDGIVSILFALGLILLYIAIRFDIRYAPGAVVALMHDVIITFGILTVVGMEITLESVAALLAIVGYSLNDTIVTFDRIRENLQVGSDEPMENIVNKAINECLSRTLLTSITTLLAVISLASVTSGVIQDFGITLVIGVLVGTYSSIFVASPVMLWMNEWVEKRKARQATQRRLEGAKSSS